MVLTVPTYGQNLKRLRGDRRQEHLASAAGKARQANLPTYENDKRFPTPALVEQHAAMLECATTDLMIGVVTGYDRVRWPDLTDAQLEALLSALSVMSKDKRMALAESQAAQVAAFLERRATPRAHESNLASLATAKRIHRGKKRA